MRNIQIFRFCFHFKYASVIYFIVKFTLCGFSEFTDSLLNKNLKLKKKRESIEKQFCSFHLQLDFGKFLIAFIHKL